jgi:hypothetical protein
VVSKKRILFLVQTIRTPLRAIDGPLRGVNFETFSWKRSRQTHVRPAALRRLGDDGQGARCAGSKAKQHWPAPNRKDEAIQRFKTMAGSPDADLASRPASGNLAHGFMSWRFMPFVKP